MPSERPGRPRMQRPPRRRRSLIAPVVLTAFSTAVLVLSLVATETVGEERAVLHVVALCGVGFAVAWLLMRLLDVFVWRPMHDQAGNPPPRLLVDLGRVLVILTIVTTFVTVVFNKPITGLLVSSGVIGIVLGLALQRMIADFFSGIAISVEVPFRVGQWVEVDGVSGQVIEINWRATRLVTHDEVLVVIPNSRIAESPLWNFEMPDGWFRIEIAATVEHAAPVSHVKRVLLAAVRSVSGVLDEPASDVLVGGFGERGVEYRVRWYMTDYRDLNVMRDAVMSAVTEHLYQAGLSLAYPKRDLFLARMTPRETDASGRRRRLLGRMALLGSLTPDELATLVPGLIERRVAAGDVVMRQGESGDSLFLVVEGLLAVELEVDGRPTKVAMLNPGQYFGEMSLLTGEPRTATVVAQTDCVLYELTRNVLAPVLQARPEIAEQLTAVIAARQAALQSHVEETGRRNSTGPTTTDGQGLQLLRRIQRLFDLM